MISFDIITTEIKEGFFLYQEEHSGLHDLPGQLVQDALFQKDLQHKSKATFKIRSAAGIKHRFCHNFIWNWKLNAESRFNREVSYKVNGDITFSYLYPARLHYLVVASQPGLDLEQLLEDVLKRAKKIKAGGEGISMETFTQRTSDFLVAAHPLFHDVISVIGHLLYYDEGSWEKDTVILICLRSTNHQVLLQVEITLRVLVIVWILRQVSQVIWNTDPNPEGSASTV